MAIQSLRISFVLNWLIFVGILSNATSVLGDDTRQARALIGLMASDRADQWEEAIKSFQSLPADSKCRPICTQAIALIEIRRGRFSDAWKLLASQSAKLDSASVSLRLGHERLNLWLLLEAGLGEQAESQFKRLVKGAINSDLNESQRRELCYFLGSVIGMLKSSGEEKSIPIATLDKGRFAIESLDSKSAVEDFGLGLKTTERWAHDLLTKSQDFSAIGIEKSKTQIDLLSKDHQASIASQQEAEDGLRSANKVKSGCKDEERMVRAQHIQIVQELKKETPGRPRKPIAPTGSKPSRPSTKYRTDPVTKQRVPDDQANEIADRKYRIELADYERAVREFEYESRTYAARLEEWKKADALRRGQLEAQKLAVSQTLAIKEAELKEAQVALTQQVDLAKASTEAEKQLRRSLTIAQIAYQHLNSATSTAKSLFRPSNFELLNYNSEATRLAKSLHELSP